MRSTSIINSPPISDSPSINDGLAKAPTRRVLSLWLPYFTVEQERVSASPNTPVVATMEARGQWIVAGIGVEAAGCGIAVGMSMGDARAMVPDLRASPRDRTGEQRRLERLADWCGRYTPMVGLDPSGGHKGDAGLWLDIAGCVRDLVGVGA